MTKLDENSIIKIFQKNLGNKKFISEDIEVFNFGKTKIAAKIDTLVQSTDIPSKMKLKDAARKSVVACVSDFSAKGVRPQFGIVSINLPKAISRSKINEIAFGLKKASSEFDITILGGDTNEGKEIVFHVCIFGKTDTIISRKGAKIGDSIFVTGPFGYTAAGLEILLHKKKGNGTFTKKAIKSVIKPKPRLNFGLNNKNYFSSSMDSSDGLSTTLNEMSKQSKKKFVINKIPANNDLILFAKHHKIETNNLVFHGGEEYEIIFTVPQKYKKIVIKNSSFSKTPIIEIGYVEKGSGVFVENKDRKYRLKDLGWHHFKK